MPDEPSPDPDHPGYLWVLDCPCGERLRGDSEDDIVEIALAHLGERHPGLTYEREHILFMTTKFRR